MTYPMDNMDVSGAIEDPYSAPPSLEADDPNAPVTTESEAAEVSEVTDEYVTEAEETTEFEVVVVAEE